jgi:hypothetical protein
MVMYFAQSTTSRVATLFLLGVLACTDADNVNESGKKSDLKLNRHEVVKSHLRSLKDDKDDFVVNEQHLEHEEFEEDEELWERILRHGLSIPDTPAPTLPPFRPPTPRPPVTPPPVTPPTSTFPPTFIQPILPVSEECELDMEVLCFEIEGAARIPCREVVEPEDELECLRDVEYVYRIENTCDPNIRSDCDPTGARITDFANVRNGVVKDLTFLVPDGARILPTDTLVFIESGLEFDFCVNKTVDTSTRVVGDTFPGLTVGFCVAEGSNVFDIGFVPDRPCQVITDVACFTEDRLTGTRTNCRDIPMPTDDDECIKEVVYSYIVTNVGSVDKTILSLDRTRDGVMRDLKGFLERLELAPGQISIARETGQVLDFCEQRVVTTVVEVESEAAGVGPSLSCRDSDTHTFTIAIVCDITVTAQCFADPSRDFSIPCSEFNPFDSVSSMVGCEHIWKYVYTIDNTGPGDAVIENVITNRDGVTSNILDRRFDLEPDAIRTVDDFQLVDFCQEYPNGIKTTVEVTADMVPIGGSCFDEDEITVFPSVEECDVALNPRVLCTVEDLDGSRVLCSVYHEKINDLDDPGQCRREVTFEYTLVNEGLSCLVINSVTSEIDNLGITDITPMTGVTLCPQEALVLTQTDIEDFCDEDLEDIVVILVNGGPPESCGGVGVLGFFPPVEETECMIELDLTCANSSGDDCAIISGSQTQCDFHPCFLDLIFSGGDCDSSKNTQSYKFACRDFEDVAIPSSAHVVVQSTYGSQFFVGIVEKGEMFRVGNSYHKLEGDLIVMIYESEGGKMLQKLSFVASCEKPLFTNDIFGAVAVSGFGNKKYHVSGAEASGGGEFQFNYDISNIGESDARLRDIVFFVGGTELAPVALSGTVRPGNSFMDSQTLALNSTGQSIDVTALVIAESPIDSECRATDEAVVDYETERDIVQCLDCPFSFTFKFSGGTCDASKNYQDIHCTDKDTIPESAYIFIADSTFQTIFFQGHVDVGSVFEVTAAYDSFYTDTVVKIMSGDTATEAKIAQIVQFHTSCRKPLFLGDTFGAIEVLGWVNEEQGTVI